VRRLAEAVVGGTFGSAAKISGSLEELIRTATGQETDSSGEMRYDQRYLHTSSMTSGIRHGGDVFVNSVVNGFSGLVEGPVSGFQRGGVSGAVTGTLKGIVGLVAAPVTGALGAVSVVTESVRQSAQFSSTGRAVDRRRRKTRRTILKYVVSGMEAGLKTQHSARVERLKESDWTSSLPDCYNLHPLRDRQINDEFDMNELDER
jgi:hypothetical protein